MEVTVLCIRECSHVAEEIHETLITTWNIFNYAIAQTTKISYQY
jgi:hypothetical protein